MLLFDPPTRELKDPPISLFSPPRREEWVEFFTIFSLPPTIVE